jgi:hypothetical protein
MQFPSFVPTAKDVDGRNPVAVRDNLKAFAEWAERFGERRARQLVVKTSGSTVLLTGHLRRPSSCGPSCAGRWTLAVELTPPGWAWKPYLEGPFLTLAMPMVLIEENRDGLFRASRAA